MSSPPGKQNGCFNSKMVRLKVIREKVKGSSLGVFQFQNGTIKSTPGLLLSPEEKLFQFQNGTIKSYKGIISKLVIYSFNSKMVRLKVIFTTKETINYPSFQFQNGTIKRLK